MVRVTPDGRRGCYMHDGHLIPCCWGSINSERNDFQHCDCVVVVRRNRLAMYAEIQKDMGRIKELIQRVERRLTRLEKGPAKKMEPTQ